MKKMRSKKGFTLMELLIVVAIIAILVAIAIPTFTSALNKAKQSTDDANIRAAYAEHQIYTMDSSLIAADATYSSATKTITFSDSSTYVLQYYSDVNTTGVWKGTP